MDILVYEDNIEKDTQKVAVINWSTFGKEVKDGSSRWWRSCIEGAEGGRGRAPLCAVRKSQPIYTRCLP
jgi:hypothetical protein